MSNAKKIKILELKRQRIIKMLLVIREMIPGTFGTAYRRCGKPSCRCAKGEGHAYVRITWTENGQGKTRTIAEKDLLRIQQLTESHQKFRKLLKNLRDIEKSTAEAIKAHKKEIIQKTRAAENQY